MQKLYYDNPLIPKVMIHDFSTLAGIMAAAEELQESAHKMGLEYWLDIDFHFMNCCTRITKGIGPGRLEIWPGCTMGKLSEEFIRAKMEEAAEVLAKHNKDQAILLEKEIADLQEKLKTKQEALRKVTKEDAK